MLTVNLQIHEPMSTERDPHKAFYAICDVMRELQTSMENNTQFPSLDVGAMELLAAFGSFWEETRADNTERAKIEAGQVAVMALRFLIEM